MVQYLCVHDQYEYDRKALAQWLYVTKRQKKEIKGYIKKIQTKLTKRYPKFDPLSDLKHQL